MREEEEAMHQSWPFLKVLCRSLPWAVDERWRLTASPGASSNIVLDAQDVFHHECRWVSLTGKQIARVSGPKSVPSAMSVWFMQYLWEAEWVTSSAEQSIPVHAAIGNLPKSHFVNAKYDGGCGLWNRSQCTSAPLFLVAILLLLPLVFPSS